MLLVYNRKLRNMSFPKRSNRKYGAKSPQFIMLQYRMIDSENFRNLSNKSIRLLLDLWRQYNGSNNGDLCVAWSIMSKKGWRSRDTLRRALKELLYYEFIELTRQGGKNRCSLYALTCRSIDSCQGKLHVAETRRASNRWKTVKPKYKPAIARIADVA